MTPARVPAAACLGCGCTCDDITLVVQEGAIVEAERACDLGKAWFGTGLVPAHVRLAGREAPLPEALEAAAALVSQAGRVLVFLADDVSCEGQRVAAALADILHGSIDSLTTGAARAGMLAVQERGRPAATLGEIRHRADTIVYWGVNPAARHPRFAERYASSPARLVAAGVLPERMVVAVDVGAARGPARADHRVAVEAAGELDILTALCALIEDAGRATAPGVPPGLREPARTLADLLARARYVAVVADAEATGQPDGRTAGLLALTRTLNGTTRAALCLLRGGGNRPGADAVLTWQTGYPSAVGFAGGYPRYHPFDGSGEARLERGEVDALVFLGSTACIPARIMTIMSRVSSVVIGPRASEGPLAGAAVVIDSGVAGIHEAGTAVRMDDVPIPLRRVLDGPPAAAALMQALVERVAMRMRSAAS